MDFFAHQDRARKRTTLLVVCYGLAVAAITAAIYILFLFIFAAADDSPQVTASLWHPEVFFWTFLLVPGVIVAGTLFKVASLNRGGGATVARSLGGRQIQPNTTDGKERRLLNIVEEMALAAGVPVPDVYLLAEEPGINAFAAGFSTKDAVIGVTRGCIEQLSRDELQGVIAHEYSHIVNGDMRLNLKLMGVLFGIIMITLIGRILLRTVFFSGGSRSSRGGNKKGGNPLPFIGLALMIIGYIGVFFASIIKSAVSRQREYLADASAVQFTRNPGGIAGALARIGKLSYGSKVQNAHASEASHLFFGNCATSSWFGMMATHPPLTDRIKRIDAAGTWATASKGQSAGATATNARTTSAPEEEIDIEVAGAINIMAAQAMMARMPENLTEAAHDTLRARALTYALLWSETPDIRAMQQKALQQHDPEALALMESVLPEVRKLPQDLRLPLAERTLPALRQMPKEAYPRFSAAIIALTEADQQISLFEFAIRSLTLRHLASTFGKIDKSPIKHKVLEPVLPQVAVVLSALANWGTASEEAAATCYQAGAEALSPSPCGSRREVSLSDVEQALEVLATTAPFIKKRILQACSATILQDGRVDPNQYELLRAVADALEVPMPPLQTAISQE